LVKFRTDCLDLWLQQFADRNFETKEPSISHLSEIRNELIVVYYL
jgi:hypothetical protein